jgi:hypothetical protein
MHRLRLLDLSLELLHLFLSGTGIYPIAIRPHPVDLRPCGADRSPKLRIVKHGYDLARLHSAAGLDQVARQVAADLGGNVDFRRADNADHRLQGLCLQQTPPMPRRSRRDRRHNGKQQQASRCRRHGALS